MLHAGNANLVLPVSTNQPTKKQKKMADNVFATAPFQVNNRRLEHSVVG